MFLSLEDYLAQVEDHLPSVLVSPAALLDIRSMGRELPPARSACFECPLGQVGGETDFSMCVDGAIHTLARRNAFAKLNTSSVNSPPWQRFRAFCDSWSDSAFLRQIRNVWLEFDRSRHPMPVDRPNVFFGVHRTRNRQELGVAGLRVLQGGPLPAELTNAISFCFGTLPPDARVFQVGVMFSRKDTPIRLCVIGITREQLLDYLSSIGWPGSLQDVEGILRSLPQNVRVLAADFDLDGSTGQVGPRLGIECYMGREYSLVNVYPDWERFLEQLVGLELCLPDERDALLAWPGYEPRRIILPSVIYRGVNHVKVVWEPPGSVHAKAYLVFLHRWVRGPDPGIETNHHNDRPSE